MRDRMQYDALKEVDTLVMPVLLMVGDGDDSTPLEQQKQLYEALPGKRELHVIEDAPHTFRDKKQLTHIKKLLKEWIGKSM